MSETWFIGDTHFGHKNILIYEPMDRPFVCLEEMNETIVERWNSVVSKQDKVYHLGDFAFGKTNIAIAGRLKGNKRLILGNHDCYPMEEYLKYFKSVHGALFLKEFLLTHIPVHPDCLSGRVKYNVHGHTHSKTIADQRYINVSCEQNNLTPINAHELLTLNNLIEAGLQELDAGKRVVPEESYQRLKEKIHAMTPNEITIAAMKEAENGGLKRFNTVKEAIKSLNK